MAENRQPHRHLEVNTADRGVIHGSVTKTSDIPARAQALLCELIDSSDQRGDAQLTVTLENNKGTWSTMVRPTSSALAALEFFSNSLSSHAHSTFCLQCQEPSNACIFEGLDGTRYTKLKVVIDYAGKLSARVQCEVIEKDTDNSVEIATNYKWDIESNTEA